MMVVVNSRRWIWKESTYCQWVKFQISM